MARSKTTVDDEKKCCHLTMKDILSFISSLLLPLMLLVFTVVMYFHQQNVATQQRSEDRYLAKEQREQDLNISRIQRIEDRQIAYEQREQDKLQARLQREQDLHLANIQRDEDELRRIQDLNISQAQRRQDKQIADEKLNQDASFADLQRNISQLQRNHELHLETERYRDALLINYIQEITDFLIKHNGTFVNDPFTHALVRVKTLTTIRRLDSKRNSQLIRFLYDVDLLNNKHSVRLIDLSGAELNGIDLSASVQHARMHCINLAGAYLNDSLFIGLDLSEANFSRAHLAHARFTNTILINADFSVALLYYTDFYGTHAPYAIFKSIHTIESRSIRCQYDLCKSVLLKILAIFPRLI